MQSASIEGKQNTPSNGPATRARNSCGTTMRRLASSCFSKVERNISPRPLLAAGKPDRTHHVAAGPPLALQLTMDNGLTWDELGYNDSEGPKGPKSKGPEDWRLTRSTYPQNVQGTRKAPAARVS